MQDKMDKTTTLTVTLQKTEYRAINGYEKENISIEEGGGGGGIQMKQVKQTLYNNSGSSGKMR